MNLKSRKPKVKRECKSRKFSKKIQIIKRNRNKK